MYFFLDLSDIFAKLSKVSTIRVTYKMCLACDTIVPSIHGHKENRDLLTHVTTLEFSAFPSQTKIGVKLV